MKLDLTDKEADLLCTALAGLVSHDQDARAIFLKHKKSAHQKTLVDFFGQRLGDTAKLQVRLIKFRQDLQKKEGRKEMVHGIAAKGSKVQR